VAEGDQNVADARAEPASILIVCTGNVCRSPLMERLLVSRLDERLGAEQRSRQIAVASAGTRALVGQPMTDDTARELVRLGGDPASFVARQVTAAMVKDADLVVTATRAHRSEVVTLSPRATRYTFTAVELARLLRELEPWMLSGDAGARALDLAARAASRRGFTPPVPRGADDVTDPYGRAPRDYRRASDQMEPAVDTLAAAIVG
jgi:low molecular weight protein-tyrosine phosphatase